MTYYGKDSTNGSDSDGSFKKEAKLNKQQELLHK